MIKYIKKFFEIKKIEYLPVNWCEGKTNEELLSKLKTENQISLASGHMIVIELLERLIKDKEISKQG
jgi:hypothetical protein